jgi:hypothetical protein
LFLKILLFNEKFSSEWHHTRASLGKQWVHRPRYVGDGRVEVRQHQFKRAKDAEYAGSIVMECSTDTKLQLSAVFHRVRLRNPNTLTELAHCTGWYASPAEATQRVQPRIIPTLHVAFVNKALHLALTGERIHEIETRKFYLTRKTGARQDIGEGVDDPIIQRSVDLKLHRTKRVRDPFQSIAQTVREVI